MNRVRVVGAEECLGADVERDEWISLKASWWPRSEAQPLYLLVYGADGGEVELKVDPSTGALLAIIVIDEPPAPSEIGVGSTPTASESSKVRPILDRSAWLEEGQGVGEYRSVVRATQKLELSRAADLLVLRFGSVPEVELLRCDAVSVGISAARTLVSLWADLSA